MGKSQKELSMDLASAKGIIAYAINYYGAKAFFAGTDEFDNTLIVKNVKIYGEEKLIKLTVEVFDKDGNRE